MNPIKKLFSMARKVAAPIYVSPAQEQRVELERVLALAGAAEHPIFKAVLALADEHARNEHESALAPDLTNEKRHFNCGRSAGAYDFTHALRKIQENAEAKARKMKAQE